MLGGDLELESKVSTSKPPPVLAGPGGGSAGRKAHGSGGAAGASGAASGDVRRPRRSLGGPVAGNPLGEGTVQDPGQLLSLLERVVGALEKERALVTLAGLPVTPSLLTTAMTVAVPLASYVFTKLQDGGHLGQAGVL